MPGQKVNVLQFICPTGFFGAERWVLALANNLDRESVQCELAVIRERGLEVPEIVRHFPGHKSVIETGGRFDPSAVGDLCRLIREREVQIVHTHGYKSDIIGVLAARRTGVRCVSTPHGFGETKDMSIVRRLYHRLGGLALRHTDSVVPLSPDLVREVADFGVLPAKTLCIANGVDLQEIDELLADRPELARSPDGKRRIGYVGQLIPRKRVMEVLDAFDEIAREGDYELVLVGEGPERAMLQSYAATLASREQITFVGFRDDRLAIMRSLDLFVLASSQEGVPRVMMEVMALGVPVVAYDIPGVDQLVTPGVTGLLAPSGDTRALAARCRQMLNDVEGATTMAAGAERRVREEFGAKRMAERYTRHFRSLIATTAK